MSVKHLIAPSVLSLSLGLVACGTKKKDKSETGTQVNKIAESTTSYMLCKEAVDAYKKASTDADKAKVKLDVELVAFAKDLIDGKYVDLDASKLGDMSKVSISDCASAANGIVKIEEFSASAKSAYSLKFIADLDAVQKLSLAGFGIVDVTYGEYNAAKAEIEGLADSDAYTAALTKYTDAADEAAKKAAKTELDTATTDAIKNALKTKKLQDAELTPELAIKIYEEVKLSEKGFAAQNPVPEQAEKDASVRVPALSAIKGLKNVVKLDLAGNKLADVKDLEAYKKMTHLDVTGQHNLVDGQDKLKNLATALRKDDGAVLAEVSTALDMSNHGVKDVKFTKDALKLADEIKKTK